MVGVITVPFQNDLGVPQLRSRVGLFASIAALKKVQRISAAILHAHCGAFENSFSCHAERSEASIFGVVR